MIEFPYGCQILRRTAGTIDDGYGNLLPTTGTVDTFCDLQQVGRDEPITQGENSITTWSLYMPVDTALDTTDAVVVGGKTYELTGDPWVADTGSNAVNHIEATVVRQGQG
jgi:hypothetical protein